MTTAHRPTFDPARGNANTQAAGSILHKRMLPAHTKLKYRQKGQGGVADSNDDEIKTNEGLKRKLLESEQDHMQSAGLAQDRSQTKEEKRRKILEEYKSIDAVDDDDDEGEDDSSDESDDEDETALLMKELENIKNERAEEKQKEEEKQKQKEEEDREREIAYSNPLLNPTEFQVKKTWTEDTIFKNQAIGSDNKQKGFVNDMLRSDFHKKFMDKYIK